MNALDEREEQVYMQQFQEEIVINCPIEVVFAHLTNLSRPEVWAVFHSEDSTIEMGESESEVVDHQIYTPPVHLVTEGPLRVGTTLIQSNESSSQPMLATIKVTAYEPPHTFSLRQVSDFGVNYLSYQLQSENDQTLLTVRIEMKPAASMIAIVDQIAPTIEPQLKQSLVDLKKQLENNGS